MCMYSLMAPRNHGYKAKVGEVLTKGDYHGHAAFRGEAGMLACIKHGTMLTFDELRFASERFAPEAAQWVTDRYAGKSRTVKFVELNHRPLRYRHFAADGLEMPDGYIIAFGFLANGVTAFIPRKVRKDKGVAKPRNLMKALGLDQIRADLPPDPKPEEAPAEPKPVEPAPVPTEPEPAAS
jgi:hypothetical protein